MKDNIQNNISKIMKFDIKNGNFTEKNVNDTVKILVKLGEDINKYKKELQNELFKKYGNGLLFERFADNHGKLPDADIDTYNGIGLE